MFTNITNTVLLLIYISTGLQFQDATNLGNAEVSSFCVLNVVYFLAEFLNDEVPGCELLQTYCNTSMEGGDDPMMNFSIHLSKNPNFFKVTTTSEIDPAVGSAKTTSGMLTPETSC